MIILTTHFRQPTANEQVRAARIDHDPSPPYLYLPKALEGGTEGQITTGWKYTQAEGHATSDYQHVEPEAHWEGDAILGRWPRGTG